MAELIPKVFAFPGGVYNFGCETDMSIYQITKLFLQFIGSTDKVQDAPERHNLWMDCSKAPFSWAVINRQPHLTTYEFPSYLFLSTLQTPI